MKSVRLNYNLRHKIKNNALDAAIPDCKAEFSQLAKDACALAGVEVRAGDGQSYIWLRVTREEGGAERTAYVHFDDDSRVPHGANIVLTNAEIFDRYLVITARENSASQNRRTLGRKLDALLASVTTTKRLAEVWPEGKQFIPESEATTDGTNKAKEAAAEVTEMLLDLGMELEA